MTENPHIMLEIRLPEVQEGGDSRVAYEALHAVEDISLPASFYLWLAELMGLKPGDVYLDVSCGRGQLTGLAHGRGINAHGLDLSETVIRMGHVDGNGGGLVVGNGQALPYRDASFRVVSNIGSLEHYVDMAAAVREMVRVLAPGGRAFVLVPNTFSLLTNIWIAFRQGRTSIDHQPIQRYAARWEWQALLEANGLIVDRTIKYERERPRTWRDLLNYLQRPKQLVRLLLTPIVPLNLAFCFVFVGHKPAGQGTPDAVREL
jgi:ubiquinone/menaquinone biosynthesis C-methylase UbiE